MSQGIFGKESGLRHLDPQPPFVPSRTVTTEELDLVKRTVANGATDAELKLYLFDCARQNVHPLDRLLHFTKRGGKYTPVTSIDLMRIRAAETGEYAGSDDAIFNTRPDDPDFGAFVTVWRIVQGQRCGFSATARWSEYYPGDQGGHMWRKMPHTMLAKCAEALALRKGFPRQLAGLYAAEEMDQAGRTVPAPVVEPEASSPAIDAVTGEERPKPPTGYYYVAGYQFQNGWHEFKLLNWSVQGDPLELSTKQAIGFLAEQAQANSVPVKCTWKARKGEKRRGYVDRIETLKADEPLAAGEPTREVLAEDGTIF